MKPKNIFKFLISSFLVSLLLSACTDNTDAEQLFNVTPVERINKQKIELQTALLSSEYGWKAVYFTDDTQLGGFTHLFKFSADGKVDMASDFNSDTKVYKSEYALVLGSTVSLLFSTNNRIHLLSDSNNAPTPELIGKGYLGDFQFLYYGQENGDLLFKSNRLVKEVRFVKATAQDWVDLPKNLSIEKKLVQGLASTLTINDGNSIKKYDFPFSNASRFVTAKSQDQGSSEIIRIAVAYTPSGIVIRPGLMVKGQNLTEFLYNELNKDFRATGRDGVTAVINFSEKLDIIRDDYKIFLPGNPYSQFVYAPGVGLENASTSSQLFKEELKAADAGLPPGQTISQIAFNFNTQWGESYILYGFDGGAPFDGAVHYIEPVEDAQGKKVILKDNGWLSFSGNPIPESLIKFDSNLTDPNGIYVTKENFKLQYPNNVYTFTNGSSTFRMTTYQVY